MATGADLRRFAEFLHKQGLSASEADKLQTHERPNFSLFRFQLVRQFAPLIVKGEPMVWEQSLRHKANGKQYRITITMEEV